MTLGVMGHNFRPQVEPDVARPRYWNWSREEMNLCADPPSHAGEGGGAIRGEGDSPYASASGEARGLPGPHLGHPIGGAPKNLLRVRDVDGLPTVPPVAPPAHAVAGGPRVDDPRPVRAEGPPCWGTTPRTGGPGVLREASANLPDEAESAWGRLPVVGDSVQGSPVRRGFGLLRGGALTRPSFAYSLRTTSAPRSANESDQDHS